MTAEEFARLFANGHGRAYLAAREDPSLLDEDALYKACGWNDTFTMEDSRDLFLSQFLDLVPNRDEVLGRVWRRLARTTKVHILGDDQFQMRWLATRYALRGDQAARRALHKRVVKNLLDGKTDGIENLLKVEGESVLPEILAVFEQPDSPLPDDEGRMIGYAVAEVFGETWLDHWLRGLPEGSRSARLIPEPADFYKRREKHEPIRTFEQLMSAFAEGPAEYSVIRRFIDEATNQEFEKAARNLPSAPAVLERYLWIFTSERRIWPIEPQPVFDLTKNKSWKVVRKAYQVLENIQTEEVRRFALRKLASRYQGQLAVNLLKTNYEPGDEVLILRRAEAAKSSSELHYVLMPLREIIKAHPEIDDGVILYLYDANPCSFCRESIVEHMVKRTLVTEQIEEECRYDASETIRLMFGGQAA